MLPSHCVVLDCSLYPAVGMLCHTPLLPEENVTVVAEQIASYYCQHLHLPITQFFSALYGAVRVFQTIDARSTLVYCQRETVRWLCSQAPSTAFPGCPAFKSTDPSSQLMQLNCAPLGSDLSAQDERNLFIHKALTSTLPEIMQSAWYQRALLVALLFTVYALFRVCQLAIRRQRQG